MKEYTKQILTAAKEGREKEVIEYQVNIDNFQRAIVLIGDDPDMQEYKARLADLLKSSKLEQRKAQIMLQVISDQLEAK
jgi:hypothetical protein